MLPIFIDVEAEARMGREGPTQQDVRGHICHDVKKSRSFPASPNCYRKYALLFV